MLTSEERERYLRHILLREVGAQGQQALLSARVLIVGAGGLGAPIIQYLAAAGVGTIGVADDDIVALSNLQRQIIYRTKDVGAPKVDQAAAFAMALNPGVQVIPYRLKVDAANGAGLLKSYDLAVEGIDTFEGRFALNSLCIAARKPLVSAAISRFDGQLSVFKPYAGSDLPCYRCLAPEAPPAEGSVNCAQEGVMGPVAGVIGALAAQEVLKEILGLGESLAGRLLIYDALRPAVRTVKLPRDPLCQDCGDVERDQP